MDEAARRALEITPRSSTRERTIDVTTVGAGQADALDAWLAGSPLMRVDFS